MKEILDETLQLLESGQDFALVKLAAGHGSTPRAAGAEMRRMPRRRPRPTS